VQKFPIFKQIEKTTHLVQQKCCQNKLKKVFLIYFNSWHAYCINICTK